jgi:type I restriction enzyme M protein
VRHAQRERITTCGSGSLLIKVVDAAPKGLTVYGQEKDNATWALAKMNMILHGNPTADIRLGDTIVDPKFRSGDKLDTFDFLVANPPFSVKSWTNGLENEYGRFDGYGRPPEKNGDYAFLLHMVISLKSTGKGAVILPHGVLFRGNVEATVRKELIKRGYIKGIIGLPPNLFYGTGIPACIVVLDKEKASDRTGMFMIDASKGFMKDGNKNRLRSRDMHKIVDTFNKQTVLDGYSRMVPLKEIANAKNDYNLNIPRYIDSSEPEDIQDLYAHLQGGTPEPDIDALQPYWDAFPSLRSTLFKPNRPGYVDLGVDICDVQQLVLDSDEFKKFATDVRGKVDDWFTTHLPALAAIDANIQPNELIGVVGNDLLARFKSVALIDEYDMYEQLMTYWHETMHDDVFMVMNQGWADAAQPRAARIIGNDANGKPKYEDAHIVTGSRASTKRYVMDLVLPALVIDRYLADDQNKVAELAAAAEQAAQVLEEYVQEHGIEEGLIWDAVDDAGKVTQKSVNAALRDAKASADDETVKALEHVLKLLKQEAAAKKSAREAQAALDNAIVKKYKDLSEDDVKSLVLGAKWHTTVTNRIESEVTSLTQTLVFRIEQLGERYAETVGEFGASVADLESKVAHHLEAMGISS